MSGSGRYAPSAVSAGRVRSMAACLMAMSVLTAVGVGGVGVLVAQP
jgi:hypothetical protein